MNREKAKILKPVIFPKMTPSPSDAFPPFPLVKPEMELFVKEINDELYT